MSRYTFPVTLSSAKKNGSNTRLLEMAQNTFTLGLSRSISITAWGFWDPHIRVLCLLTFPDKKKFASSLKVTRLDKPWSVSILRSKSSQNASRLDGSSCWSFCTSCSLYGYNFSHFRRIFLTVGSGIFNSWLALRIFPGAASESFMHSVDHLFGNTWPPRATLSLKVASSVTKLFIPPLDRCIRRTMTSNLPSKRALDHHKIVTLCKFQDTNYAWSVRQPFPSNTGLHFSCEMAVATIGPFQMLRSLCNRHEFHDLVTLPTQVMA